MAVSARRRIFGGQNIAMTGAHVFFLFIQLDLTDFYDEDYDLDTDDDNQDSGDSDYANGDDSGNGET